MKDLFKHFMQGSTKCNSGSLTKHKLMFEKCDGRNARAIPRGQKNKAEPKFLMSTIKQSGIPPHCGAHLAARTHFTAVAALYKGTIEGAPSV